MFRFLAERVSSWILTVFTTEPLVGAPFVLVLLLVIGAGDPDFASELPITRSDSASVRFDLFDDCVFIAE